MRKCIGIVLFLTVCQSLAAADGIYRNSLGSKAAAMGGAFVALADDFSALFWNPAGLAVFDTPHFGLYGSDVMPRGSYKRAGYLPGLGAITLIDARTETRHHFSGLAAYYHPLGDHWTAGIGVYIPRRFGTSWRGADLARMANDDPSIDWMSNIGVATFSPAIACQMSRSVWVGASVMINCGLFELQRHAGTFQFPLPDPPYLLPIELGQYKESLSGWGYGAGFGILIKPSDYFSVGAVFRAPGTIRYKGKARVEGFTELGAAFSRNLKNVSEAERKIRWPLELALGGAFRPNRNLTLTADLQWTRWAPWDVLKTSYRDPLWSSYMSERGNDKMKLSWTNTLHARFGIECRLSETIAVRGGFHTAPSPSPDDTRNVLIPVFQFKTATFGVGLRFEDIQVDFGLEYSSSGKSRHDLEKVPVYPPPYGSVWESANPGIYAMKMLALSLSLGFNF